MKTIVLFIILILSLLFVSFELNSNDIRIEFLSFWGVIMIADVFLLYHHVNDKK